MGTALPEGAKVLVNDLGANPDGSGEEKIADEKQAVADGRLNEKFASYI